MILSSSTLDDIELKRIVDALCVEASQGLTNGSGRIVLPDREIVVEAVESLRSVLFPGYFGNTDLRDESLHYYIGATLDHALHKLCEQIRRGIAFAEHHPADDCADLDKAKSITRRFMGRLPALQRTLASDVEAAYEGDPALQDRAEAIFCYPGIFAVTNYRIAHELHVLGVPLIPRMITEQAHALTGVDIHPGAEIGDHFFIDHATGVVIGETCVIGRNVRLYQGVTLGAKSFPLDGSGNPIKGIPRHPIIEDDVIIYSGATILGRVVIGKGASIGGNVWLTHGVAPRSQVTIGMVREIGYENGEGI